MNKKYSTSRNRVDNNKIEHDSCTYKIPFSTPWIYLPKRDCKALNDKTCHSILQDFHHS